MFRKIARFFTTPALMGIMLVILAVALGTATIIESRYGTEAAKALVYNTFWFELLWLVLAVNTVGNIIRYKQFQRRKLPVFTFHIAFVLILLGAAATRYFGFRGSMHIREGETTNQILSYDNYLKVKVVANEDTATRLENVYWSDVHLDYDHTFRLGGKHYRIAAVDYLGNAVSTVYETSHGKPLVKMSVRQGGSVSHFHLRPKERKHMHGITFSLNDRHQPDIRLKYRAGNVFLTATDSLYRLRPKLRQDSLIPPGEQLILTKNEIFIYQDIQFAMRDYYEKGQVVYTNQPSFVNADGEAVIKMALATEGTTRLAYLKKSRTLDQQPQTYILEDAEVTLALGAKTITLPFSLKLEDFIMKRYPGSSSPSSYISKVQLTDKPDNYKNTHTLYMNHVLQYEGYRFYQSSYDEDEKGTILSVNHDPAGTWITYAGYFLMILGMVLAVIYPGSRLRGLTQQTQRLAEQLSQKSMLILLLLFAGHTATAQEQPPRMDRGHVKKFNKTLVMARDGRVKPMKTLASEVVRKLAGKNRWQGTAPGQVVLAMLARPGQMQRAPLIRVRNKQVQEKLGISSEFASYSDFFMAGGQHYKLEQGVQQAYMRNPAARDPLDKAIIKVNEKLNVAYMVYSGDILKIIPDTAANKWFAPNLMQESPDPAAFPLEALFREYLQDVRQTPPGGDWTAARQSLEKFQEAQGKHAAPMAPSRARLNTEILYMQLNIFERLTPLYALAGIAVLALGFLLLFFRKTRLHQALHILKWVLVGLFVVHTIGLGLRWYISGHAPWSNGYESMIYIAWASVLAGLLFSRRSDIAFGATALMAAITLLVAHMSWMNPEITTLVPVLKSHWLTFHVAIITASYGFLGLSALLGFLNLLLILFRYGSIRERMQLLLKQLTAINEISLVFGLYLLAIGTFLGGIWANESWGRYWGWDPKETWSLITILVYAFVTHMRLIPGFRGVYAVNLGALLAYASVLMTFFGVNYYLSGLHAYANGEPAPVPDAAFYFLVLLASVALGAYLNEHKHQRNLRAEKQRQNGL